MRHDRILAVALVCGALAAFASAAWAGPIPDQAARERDAFLATYAKTAQCMRTSVIAARRAGITEASAIRGFAKVSCAGGMRYWLTVKNGMGAHEADAVIDHMTQRALDTADDPPAAIIVI